MEFKLATAIHVPIHVAGAMKLCGTAKVPVMSDSVQRPSQEPFVVA